MSARLNVVVTEPAGYSPAALAEYAKLGEVRLGEPTREWVLANAADADVLVVRLGLLIDEEILANAPRLRAVASPTTALNHVDEAACRRRGVEVFSLRGETAFLERITATAEHTFGLILALVRGTVRAHQHVLDGGWERDEFRGRDLSALTLGVVGYGRVGRQVASYADAFGMNVLAHDRSPDDASGRQMVSLGHLLANSDIVSLHVSYSAENRKLLGPRELDAMRPGSYLVNTSRGEMVDEDAVAAAIESGRLRGAAMDVLSDEHDRVGLQANRMVQLARAGHNVVLTPHLGGCTSDSMEATELFVAEKVRVHYAALDVSR